MDSVRGPTQYPPRSAANRREPLTFRTADPGAWRMVDWAASPVVREQDVRDRGPMQRLLPACIPIAIPGARHAGGDNVPVVLFLSIGRQALLVDRQSRSARRHPLSVGQHPLSTHRHPVLACRHHPFAGRHGLADDRPRSSNPHLRPRTAARRHPGRCCAPGKPEVNNRRSSSGHGLAERRRSERAPGRCRSGSGRWTTSRRRRDGPGGIARRGPWLRASL